MFEYVRILVPSYDIGIWSHKWKKTCADYDMAILCLYGYIPVYTKYNLVHTMCVHIQWQLSYFLFQGSVLLLDHASIHPPCTVQRSLQPKVKKNTCADHQVCRLGTLVYIPVYTTYSSVHTEIYHPLLGIRLKPSCEPVLSRLPACAVHCSWRPSSPQSAR